MSCLKPGGSQNNPFTPNHKEVPLLKRKPFAVLRHACNMVGRNIRSYAMLSVTIILSFSILLGFMGYMDSEHYNTYKKTLAMDRGYIHSHSRTLSPARVAQLQERAAEYGITHSTQYQTSSIHLKSTHWKLPTGERLDSDLAVKIYSIPRECWFVEVLDSLTKHILENYTVTWLDGRKTNNITLEAGQIILDELLYHALGFSPENPTKELQFYDDFTKVELKKTFTVVGTVPSNVPMKVETYQHEITGEMLAKISNSTADSYMPVAMFSLDDLNPQNFETDIGWLRYIIFYSDQPENVYTMLKTMEPNLAVSTVYEGQNRALEQIQTEKGTKAIIAALLLVILGINLYSSFENALNDRKFEIGVKRAMGASGFSIIRQFFYESMIVMTVNTVIAVATVVNVGLLLKLYRQFTMKDTSGLIRYTYETYTLYITPYSVGMFAVCAVVLTVVFSFVFAYKTTQVQIVDYLKAE